MLQDNGIWPLIVFDGGCCELTLGYLPSKSGTEQQRRAYSSDLPKRSFRKKKQRIRVSTARRSGKSQKVFWNMCWRLPWNGIRVYQSGQVLIPGPAKRKCRVRGCSLRSWFSTSVPRQKRNYFSHYHRRFGSLDIWMQPRDLQTRRPRQRNWNQKRRFWKTERNEILERRAVQTYVHFVWVWLFAIAAWSRTQKIHPVLENHGCIHPYQVLADMGRLDESSENPGRVFGEFCTRRRYIQTSASVRCHE